MKKDWLSYPTFISVGLLSTVWGYYFAKEVIPKVLDEQGTTSDWALALMTIAMFFAPAIVMGLLANYLTDKVQDSSAKLDRENERRMILYVMISASKRESIAYKESIRDYIVDRYDIRLSKKTLDARMAGLYLDGYIVRDGIFGYRLTEKGKNRFAIKEE